MEIQKIMTHAKQALADIAAYEPLYRNDPDQALADKLTQFKWWLKNYADSGTLAPRVGPINMMKHMAEWPWFYDYLKSNSMFQSLCVGRSGNYLEAVGVTINMIINTILERLEWAMTEPERLILCKDMVSPEIPHAMGLHTWMPEMFGASGTSCDQHASERYIDIAEHAGIGPDSCCMPKVGMGLALAGALPKPVAIIGSNLACDPGATAYSLNQRHTGNPPIYRIDVPHYFLNSDRARDLVVEDLKRMIKFLEANTVGRMDWDKLREICTERNKQHEYQRKVWELNKRRPTPMPGEPVYLHSLISSQIAPGQERCTKSWKRVYELAQDNFDKGIAACPKERYRALVWDALPPCYGDLSVWCEQTWGLTFYIDSMSYNTNPMIDTSTPDSMLRDLATCLMSGPMARYDRGPGDNYFRDMFRLVEECDLDMIIVPAQVGCKNTAALNGVLREKCRERNIPLLVFDCDLFDPRTMSRESIQLQFTHFMENVMQAERLN